MLVSRAAGNRASTVHLGCRTNVGQYPPQPCEYSIQLGRLTDPAAGTGSVRADCRYYRTTCHWITNYGITPRWVTHHKTTYHGITCHSRYCRNLTFMFLGRASRGNHAPTNMWASAGAEAKQPPTSSHASTSTDDKFISSNPEHDGEGCRMSDRDPVILGPTDPS